MNKPEKRHISFTLKPSSNPKVSITDISYPQTFTLFLINLYINICRERERESWVQRFWKPVLGSEFIESEIPYHYRARSRLRGLRTSSKPSGGTHSLIGLVYSFQLQFVTIRIKVNNKGEGVNSYIPFLFILHTHKLVFAKHNLFIC